MLAEKNTMTQSVKTSGWQDRDGGIAKTFEFSGLSTPQSTITLTIWCSLSRYDSGEFGVYVGFRLRPYLCLMPNGKPFEYSLTRAPFLVSLFAASSGAGTEADPIFRGGWFEVDACAIEAEPKTADFGIMNTRDVALAVKTISTGETLYFGIRDSNANPPMRLKLELPNDSEFTRRYAQLCNSA
jgi:hypothetical protein